VNKKLLIAGGGTGGHIFPGITVATTWRDHGGDVVFVGTAAGREKDIVPKYDIPLKLLNVSSLKGSGILRKLKTLFGLPRALWQAIRIIRNEKPDVILGVGGYASGPTCLAAWLLRKRTAITDQNVMPGFTNRILGRFAKKVFLSFKESEIFFSKKKVVHTGNPVRGTIQYADYKKHEAYFHIFIFGGSQGAVAMNKAFIEALKILPELWNEFVIHHQVGATDENEIRAFYEEQKIESEVKRFYDDMNTEYAQAHLVICRAGAGTVTELSQAGRPAILVPYPLAADDHQRHNALVFVKENAAWLYDQNNSKPEELADLIRHVYENPEELRQRSIKMKALEKSGAAERIVQELGEL